VANTLLTPDMIANEILRVLHANLTFLKRVDRQYDSSFGIKGAQIGSTLRIKKPPRYTVTTGASMGSFQNSTETVVPLTISTQKNIGIQFSSEELTLHINDFSQQFIQPAMNQLASTVEADVISQMIKQVPNQVGSWLSPLNAMRPVLRAGQIMTDSLALLQDRTLMINTASRVELIDSLKGLSESSGAIASQYREGTVAHVGGFDFIESTLLPTQTPANWGGTPLVGSVSGLEGTSSIATTGWTASTAAVNVGDILTFANVYAVHPETKVNLGLLLMELAQRPSQCLLHSSQPLTPLWVLGSRMCLLCQLLALRSRLLVLQTLLTDSTWHTQRSLSPSRLPTWLMCLMTEHGAVVQTSTGSLFVSLDSG
jgi:hypothetical protein